ncbi:hypothetical protein CcaverHIS002_0310830 [Cutaneotrichosporon cavernicola]|uniref:Uncharacterized protein n=1 Tax=Cutaneotrichosporon cavernicola TaxID=279322 RepID=A0AA48L2Z6_9TREE|nr:uncharacterized protein CcaverHIS019_0310690 [Cutaneotrichosporon cavernicola]BEI83215.1 hypothetical protein CcaverHIS002_0310830 [Cutaneotrichosporon cavernicola]BEI90999.1 hypothetical protein CcaverHIS019_0310690 [Cutaneotrichosporon cavernicola]BEI98778.1 hypothetical protein CcaverHIS631_0310770 [Cutaneotrichosporon cavernicola]BEJ06549.1 hypothetical protein CcaverHIS641_0310710 [Cutaneotrichosporon cavernicola]
MSGVDISATAISAFLKALPQSTLDSAPQTHLPSALPLAFPTDLHQLNLLSILHLVNAAFSQPTHRAYFAEEGGTPADTAVRGVLGMYLASDTDWGTSNLLSAKCWASGELNQTKVAEFFSIAIFKEREHESMPGVRVGERWAPAIAVADDLVHLLQALGKNIKRQCLGDEVLAALGAAKADAAGQSDEGLAFAKEFCSNAVALIPILADPYPVPLGTVLPAAPLCLLQDLAHQFGPSNPTVPLLATSALVNVSPLPLPVELLLHLGILEPEASLEGGEELRHATGDWWAGKQVDVFSLPPNDDTHKAPKMIKIPRATLDALSQKSVDACREIVVHARSTQGDEWKSHLSMLDVSRVFASLSGILDAHGMGLRLVV